jgi:hypothetical protein
MKIVIPKNIYGAILSLNFPDRLKEKVEVLPSSMVSAEIINGKADVGLIPSLDLLKYPDLKISGKIAISFDGLISNAYLYFVPELNRFEKIKLRGDVSSNEIILTKIMFQERFDIDVEVILDTQTLDFDENNYVIVGGENEEHVISRNGVSFADQIAELIDYPYVNFVLASKDENKLNELESHLKDIDRIVEDELFNLLSKMKLPKENEDMFVENIDSLYFEMTSNEKEALNELIKLAFYHGIIDEMKELNFV